MTPEAIHQLGLSEVARIKADLEKLKKEVKFKGTLTQFFDYVRTDPKFQPKTREALVELAAVVAAGFPAAAEQSA